MHQGSTATGRSLGEVWCEHGQQGRHRGAEEGADATEGSGLASKRYLQPVAALSRGQAEMLTPSWPS